MEFDVLLTTKILSLNLIPGNRELRHDIIQRLFDQGKSDREISDYLNSRGVLTPRGLSYYPKLVWVTRKKLRERMGRKKWYEYEVGRMFFYLRRYRTP